MYIRTHVCTSGVSAQLSRRSSREIIPSKNCRLYTICWDRFDVLFAESSCRTHVHTCACTCVYLHVSKYVEHPRKTIKIFPCEICANAVAHIILISRFQYNRWANDERAPITLLLIFRQSRKEVDDIVTFSRSSVDFRFVASPSTTSSQRFILMINSRIFFYSRSISW